MKYSTTYLTYKTMEPKEMSKPTMETLKTVTMETTETVGIKEMLDIKSILDKKIANYFGTEQKDPKNVGYLCLVKQVENINKHLIENNIDTTKSDTVVEDNPVKRKYVKKTLKHEPTGGWATYGTSHYASS